MKPIIFLFLLAGVWASCTKRIDAVLPGPPSTYNNAPASNSSVSLLNLYELYPADVSVNGRQLSTFMYAGTGPIGPTPWFPSGQLAYGQLFTIPDSLFDARGYAAVGLYNTIRTKNYQFDSIVPVASLNLHNNPDSPKQVILYPSYLSDPKSPGAIPAYETSTLVVAGTTSAPSKPDYFKIRIINLGAKATIPSAYDAITLTYADGSPVSSKTTNIAYRQTSEYIELPYGTYQFKITGNNGVPIQEYPGPVLDVNGMPIGLKGLAYSNLRTLKPGGVYTLLVSWHSFQYGFDLARVDYPGITWMKDNSTVASPNYIRMQAVNALPGTSNIHFAVDGQDLGSFLNFGQYTDYGRFSIGPHKVQVFDAGNAELASTVFNTYSLDNITIWAWQKQGKISLLTTSNDLSISGEPAQLNNGFQVIPPVQLGAGFGWQCRFFNLCEDVPYASFLDQSGSFADGAVGYNREAAYKQLTSGYVPATSPYVGYGLFVPYNSGPAPGVIAGGAIISAYGSGVDTVAGTPLGLTLDHPMIANRALYNSNNLPSAEAGLYTIALIGRTNSNDTASKARLIVIKHNK